MKTKTKKVYYCEHCKKHLLIASRMLVHEKACIKNPDNWRKCFQCIFLYKKAVIVKHRNKVTDLSLKQCLICEKTNNYMFTPANAAKENIFELLDLKIYPMPVECDLYVDKLNCF